MNGVKNSVAGYVDDPKKSIANKGGSYNMYFASVPYFITRLQEVSIPDIRYAVMEVGKVNLKI